MILLGSALQTFKNENSNPDSTATPRKDLAERVRALENLSESLQISNKQHLRALKTCGARELDFRRLRELHGRASSASRESHQRSGRAMVADSDFFELLDVDGDGLISFGEYMFYLTILSFTPEELDIAFRLFASNDRR